MRRPKRYDVSVFLNCPFDDGYRSLLHAALFAIQDCGFIARTERSRHSQELLARLETLPAA